MQTEFLFDLHCHTKEKSFDGEVEAAQIVRAVAGRGFDGLVFTDHNHVWQAGELEAVREGAGVGADFVLLSGQEVRTSLNGVVCGDLLVYGPGEDIADGISPMELLARAEASGGFCIAAHVGVERWGLGRRLGDFPIRAAEVWNGRYGSRAAALSARLAEEFGVVATGGSDTHRPRDIGGGGTTFPERPRSVADLKRLVLSGNCEPWKPGPGAALRRWVALD